MSTCAPEAPSATSVLCDDCPLGEVQTVIDAYLASEVPGLQAKGFAASQALEVGKVACPQPQVEQRGSGCGCGPSYAKVCANKHADVAMHILGIDEPFIERHLATAGPEKTQPVGNLSARRGSMLDRYLAGVVGRLLTF